MSKAKLFIEVFCECPNCKEPMDLMDDYNDEGQVISQACPGGHWIDEHKKFKINDVTCNSCSHVFNVSGLEW